MDGRFVNLEDNTWDLRDGYKYEDVRIDTKIIEDEDDNSSEDESENSLEEDEDEENEGFEIEEDDE